MVSQLEAVEAVSCAVHSSQRDRGGGLTSQLEPSKIAEMLPKLDALADLLAATADGLAAEWDLRADASGEEKFHVGDDIKPTIQ